MMYNMINMMRYIYIYRLIDMMINMIQSPIYGYFGCYFDGEMADKKSGNMAIFHRNIKDNDG